MPQPLPTAPISPPAAVLDEVTKVLEARTPLYQAAADVSFEVTYLTMRPTR